MINKHHLDTYGQLVDIFNNGLLDSSGGKINRDNSREDNDSFKTDSIQTLPEDECLDQTQIEVENRGPSFEPALEFISQGLVVNTAVNHMVKALSNIIRKQCCLTTTGGQSGNRLTVQ